MSGRIKSIIFSTSLRASIIFRHPKRKELNNSFLEPFTKQVWLLTIIVGILNWLFLYTTIKVERYFLGNMSNSTLLVQPESETFLITTAAVCQQGTHSNFKNKFKNIGLALCS
jgi:hypothetical protein